jgi:CRP/FNR family transcriptional regulator
MNQSPSEKLEKFFATSKPSPYKKGDVVLRIGDSRSGAFYIKKGYIKDSSISVDGREFILFIFQPKDIFSYSWIYNAVPNEHSFKAMADCVVLEKSREGLLVFLEQNPDVQFMISQNIVKRMRGLMQRIENMAFASAFQKVGKIISILAERFGKETEKGVTIPLPLTQQDISELIGLSRETTSIEIKKLMDMGILTRASGNYSITNLKKLEKLSSLLS